MISDYPPVVVLTKDDAHNGIRALSWDFLELMTQESLFLFAIHKIAEAFKEEKLVFVVGWENMFTGTAYNCALTHTEKNQLKNFISDTAKCHPNLIFILNFKSISDVKDEKSAKKISRREKLESAYIHNPFIFLNVVNYKFQFFRLLEIQKKNFIVCNNIVYIFFDNEVFEQRKTCPFKTPDDDYDFSEKEVGNLTTIFQPAEKNLLFCLQGHKFTVKACLDFWCNPRETQEVLKDKREDATYSFTVSDTLKFEDVITDSIWGREKFQFMADSKNEPLIITMGINDLSEVPRVYKYSFSQSSIIEIPKNQWRNLAKSACWILGICFDVFLKLPSDIQLIISQNPKAFCSLLKLTKMSLFEAAEILTKSNLLNLLSFEIFFKAFNKRLFEANFANEDSKTFIMSIKDLDTYSLLIKFSPCELLAKAFFDEDLVLAEKILQQIKYGLSSEFKSYVWDASNLIDIFKVLVLKDDKRSIDVFMQYVGIFQKANLYSSMLQVVLYACTKFKVNNYTDLLYKIIIINPKLLNLNNQCLDWKNNVLATMIKVGDYKLALLLLNDYSDVIELRTLIISLDCLIMTWKSRTNNPSPDQIPLLTDLIEKIDNNKVCSINYQFNNGNELYIFLYDLVSDKYFHLIFKFITIFANSFLLKDMMSSLEECLSTFKYPGAFTEDEVNSFNLLKDQLAEYVTSNASPL